MPRFLNEILENGNGVPSSKNNTIDNVEYVTKEAYNSMVKAGTLKHKTVYMIEGTTSNPVKDEIINLVYPVGSYYETSDESFDPNVEWGGNWVQDSNGKATIARDPNDSEINTVGNTAGNRTMTLSISNLPSHNHSFTGVKHSHTWSNSHDHTFTGVKHSHTWSNSHDHTFTGKAHHHGTDTSSNKFLVSKNNIAVNGTKRSFPSTSSSGSRFVYTDDSDAGINEDSSTANATQGGTVGSKSISGTTSEVTQGGTIGNTGSGTAFSMLPPVVVVIRWHRLPDTIEHTIEECKEAAINYVLNTFSGYTREDLYADENYQDDDNVYGICIRYAVDTTEIMWVSVNKTTLACEEYQW